jgi:succinate dehydrogenase / fumarate reductase membrane anchor subunit
MTKSPAPSGPTAAPSRWESRSWLLMRISALFLIPLVWIHVLIQDLLVGVHKINLDYVAMRWASLGWRIYDAALVSFTFAHGMNGLRQVLEDYVHSPRSRRILRIILFTAWLLITGMGIAALIGGVRR